MGQGLLVRRGGQGGQSSYVFGSLSISENGTYLPSSYSLDAFSRVDVNVLPSYTSMAISITENGLYKPQDYNVDAFSEVNVNVGENQAFNLTSFFAGQIESVSLNNVSSLGMYWSSSAYTMDSFYSSFIGVVGFVNQSKLSKVYAPDTTVLYSFAFWHCESLSEILLPACKVIYDSAIGYLSNSTVIDCPNVTSVGYLAAPRLYNSTGSYSDRYKIYLTNFPLSCHKLRAQTLGHGYITNYGFSYSYMSINGNPYFAVGSWSGANATLHSSCFMIAGSTQISTSLRSLVGPNVQTVCDYALYSTAGQYSYLKYVSLPNVKYIGVAAFSYKTRGLSYLDIDSCETIESYAFYHGTSGNSFLTSITATKLVSIGNSAFYNFIALDVSTFSWDNIEFVGNGAFTSNQLSELILELSACKVLLGFTYCPNLLFVSINMSGTIRFTGDTLLQSVCAPNVTGLYEYAFQNCRSLSSLYLPNCVSVGAFAFIACSNLTSLDLPECVYVSNGAFSGTYISYINLPKVTVMSGNCISGSIVQEISLPELVEIVGSTLITSCQNLTNVYVPKLQKASALLLSCPTISVISFWELAEISASYFVTYCSHLESVYFYMSSLPEVTTSNHVYDFLFYSTPILNSTFLGYYGSIYVPASLYSEYVNSPSWVPYRGRFVSM